MFNLYDDCAWFVTMSGDLYDGTDYGSISVTNSYGRILRARTAPASLGGSNRMVTSTAATAAMSSIPTDAMVTFG